MPLSDYTRLIYIESTGTQYIQTNISGNLVNYVSALCEMSWTGTTGNNFLSVKFTSGDTRRYLICLDNNNWALGVNTIISSNVQRVLNQKYTVRSQLISGNSKLIIDGSEVISSTNTISGTSNYQITIFGLNNQGTVSEYASGRLYSLKMYDEAKGDLIRDYIPVRRNSDNKLGLYDIVNDTFSTNAGTGEFIGKEFYTIGVEGNPSNLGSVSGGGEFSEGETATLTATPITGAKFSSWRLKGSDQEYSTSNPLTISVDQDLNLVADFKIEEEYSYTGIIETWEAPISGNYYLQVWGAQGGSGGGLGGYSDGYMWLDQGTTLYICVGGKGSDRIANRATSVPGGYNGGGAGGGGYTGWTGGTAYSGGSGGGATHIATVTGTLSDIGESNLDKILIVAGGGGGSCTAGGTSGAGGGLEGGQASTFNNPNWVYADGGTQTTGYAFGQGQDGRTSTGAYSWGVDGNGGGGGGLYGGYAYTEVSSYTMCNGGGGSGYTGNLLDPYTNSGRNSGNGRAKIKYVPAWVVSVRKNPSDVKAYVIGSGNYLDGETVNLIVLISDRNYGVNVISWEEDGQVISTAESYSFTVSGNRDITVNLEQYGIVLV